MRSTMIALVGMAMLASVSGAALAQVPQGGGSGEHGVGAGADPRGMHQGMMMHRHGMMRHHMRHHRMMRRHMMRHHMMH